MSGRRKTYEGNRGISGGSKERFEQYFLVLEKGKTIISEHNEKDKTKENTLGGWVMDWIEAVEKAKAGKEEGYNFLYQQTYQKSYYVALKYMKQEEAAVDVLQDAYIKAFQSLEQLQDAEKFAGWFSRIVATKALDELKKKKIVLFSQMQTEEEDISMEEILEDDRIDTQPELALDKEETSRLVQEMIDSLSDEQRFCIMMFYVEEMSVKEIAETLGVSENTVKSRLNYGRKNIKAQVLELEKRGTKLYAMAPLPFFLYLLLQDSMSAQAAPIPLSTLLEAQAASGGKAVAAKAGKTAGSLAVKKAVIGAAIGLAVCGGAAAVIYASITDNTEQQEVIEEPQQEEELSSEEETLQEEPQEIAEEEEPEEPENTEEEEPENEQWKEAYTAFVNNWQPEGEIYQTMEFKSEDMGYALLEVEGSDAPVLVIMPYAFQYLSLGERMEGMGWMITEDSCIRDDSEVLELYYYDTVTGEVKRITNVEGGTENGAAIAESMDWFYLTYLSDTKRLVGETLAGSYTFDSYSCDTETGSLKVVDTYTYAEDEDSVEKKDIIYYRTVEQAMENIGSVME